MFPDIYSLSWFLYIWSRSRYRKLIIFCAFNLCTSNPVINTKLCTLISIMECFIKCLHDILLFFYNIKEYVLLKRISKNAWEFLLHTSIFWCSLFPTATLIFNCPKITLNVRRESCLTIKTISSNFYFNKIKTLEDLYLNKATVLILS